MDKVAKILKPLVPILSVVYGLAVIYVTALPLAGDTRSVVSEVLTWLLTLVGIAMTLWIVHYVEPKIFPESDQFALKLPKISIIVGLLLMAPLWLILEQYILYGITSLSYSVQMESFTYTADELREDLLSGVHAVLLAPILEELCFRQMAISPFRRRGAQIVVCVIMAVLFGIVHIRNFPGAFLSALVYGGVFVWTRNIWYSVALHAGSNLVKTLLAVYCYLQLGDLQMTKIPVIILPDIKVIIASIVLAIVGGGLLIILYHRRKKEKTI